MKKKKIIIILVLANLLILGVGGTLSSYRTTKSGKKSFQYAAIIFNNEEVNSISIDLTDIAPGENKNLQFNVANYSGSKRSEVTISYKLIVKSYGLVPAILQIKDSNTNNIVLDCNQSTGSRDDSGLFVCESTGDLELTHTANSIANYTATVSLDTNLYEEYANQADYFEIIIDSWQKQS